MVELTPFLWCLLALGALVVGLSKTALPGGATLAVALFAAVLPARTSTATLLVLLIVGDAFALLMYRRHADWKTLVRLAPAVIAGLVVGAVFLALADDDWVRRTIGVILLIVVAFTFWLRRRTERSAALVAGGRAASIGYGTLGGFTTMVANAGGPVMSMYFLASRFEVKAFLGTAAWFFAIVNIAKLPFAIGLGLLNTHTLLIDLVLVPAVVVGALIGRLLADRMNQAVFERVVYILTIVAAVYLLF
ncbi:sulfite exporter TauE/SafE family protein [Microbacterium sp. 4R-513]|uniref:sulfite exporter TauE/SafE family protein n=1 Tax=Microbacterium sp. 4R-513 TaxID=2567934 RepID=UPI0013E1546F|nr:sulfite exporter TauE/SafE family protein [Microbacterium sp. 4R-513]QIG38704.1 sulfite exporter TauE/SafE family protein [Microbacterium sp. 4R-513]